MRLPLWSDLKDFLFQHKSVYLGKYRFSLIADRFLLPYEAVQVMFTFSLVQDAWVEHAGLCTASVQLRFTLGSEAIPIFLFRLLGNITVVLGFYFSLLPFLSNPFSD